MAIPRAARVPHTTKQPTECPYCGSRSLTRRGSRRKKLEIVQLWRCASCKRTFTPNPEAMRNRTYPLRFILSALSDYHLGYSLEETATRLAKKTKRRISPSTIGNWLGEYHAYCSYRRLRAVGKSRFPAAQTIRTIKLYHRQVYGYAYHRPKLTLLRDGLLDSKHKDSDQSSARFAALADFLENIPSTCPHELFRDEDMQARASQAAPDFADSGHAVITSKQNAATEAAALIIPAVGNNKLRHETLQKFMLINDSVTLAMEVPIWLNEPEIAALEQKHGIALLPKMPITGAQPTEFHPRHLTGHIDFLQVRNGAVHILDYKPDARTNKPIAQLAIYAPRSLSACPA